MSSRKKSTSSNSSTDKEMEFLENEFLNCKIEDIPIPKKDEIGEYESEVLEVMKTGCNRQIAEYVIIEYKKQEDKDKQEAKDKKEDNEFKTLEELRDNYYGDDNMKKIIEKAKEDLKQYKNENNFKDTEQEMEGYEEEVEKVLEVLKDVENDENEEDKKAEQRKYASFYLHKYLFTENNQPPKEILEKKKIYTDKRDAVIEAALRKIKKIVNDEEEYKKFYKDYYKKDFK